MDVSNQIFEYCRTISLKNAFYFRAGIFLSIACILFIISHIHVRWSTFPFQYRDISSVDSGLWRRNAVYNGRLVSFKIKCMNERISCTKLIIAR